MTRIIFLVVCTLALSACATGTAPRKPEPIAAELIPTGFTAADCHITQPGHDITQPGPDGQPVKVGTQPPKVACEKHDQGPLKWTTTPECHTKGGQELPLSDCCFNPDGSNIAGCTPKPQPPGQ